MKKFRNARDMPVLEAKAGNIVLFHPFVPESAIEAVSDTLRSRWIGQGPKVDLFERRFAERLGLSSAPVAVGAGTHGLHLAYVLAGISPGDEVITPVFTCTATNIPLLHLGAQIRFADVEPHSLNIDPDHARHLVTEKTKAIVCVHYGGLPCDMDELRQVAAQRGIPIIEEAAQALGATYKGVPVGDISEFTVFSFQAIKHITTGDGGMLLLKDRGLLERARQLRWFGIDRAAKQGGYWENEIRDAGFKYQMTDIAAAMGLAGLEELGHVLSLRRALFDKYVELLCDVDGVEVLGADCTDREHAAWLLTIAVDRRMDLERKLREHNIESGQIHFRNDRYGIFEKHRTTDTPKMDAIEDRYLVLPLHTQVTVEDVQRVCEVIRSGW